MKKLYFLLLLLTGIMNAQIVNIPDANFKAKLLAADISNTIAYSNGSTIKIDANADENIQLVEVQSIDSLDVSIGFISDLTGIASFSNLKRLDCGNEFTLSNLDLSGMTSLKRLYCGGSGINTMNLSGLINLEDLQCTYNNMVSLNLSGLTSLRHLNSSDNQLTSLDLSGLTSLRDVFCNNNQIQAMNINGLPNFNGIVSEYNQISNLTLTNLPNFTGAYFDNNNLTSLTLDGLINLNHFDASINALTTVTINDCPNINALALYSNLINSISFTGSTNIVGIYAQDNLLTTIDVSSLSSLSTLYCNNNLLTSIDVSNNHNFGTLLCMDNPNLESVFMKFGRPNLSISGAYALYLNPNLRYVCVDEYRVAEFLDTFAENGRSDIEVNTYCSYTPGGNYNTITGTMIFDADNNGCDVADVLHPNIRVNIHDGTNGGASFTSDTGIYTFYTQAGIFNVTPAVENPAWFTFSPTAATIPFPDNNSNIVIQDFCITANGLHPDVEVIVAPITPARPGFDAKYQVVYKNKGNQTISGNVTFGYDDAVLELVSTTVTPIAQLTGSLSFDYTNLLPFENRSFYITLHVNAPTDTPAVNIGASLFFTATINPIGTDEITIDNTFQMNQSVVGSFDPNEITCIEGNSISPAEIGNYLHYVINFENTGTADAENIVVRDIIDTTQFDVSSLQVLNSSAPVTAKLTGNVAEFIFPNINLHSGGHGNILIKIKSKNNLVEGDMVSKRANIYFDYNAPIDTDLENTIFQSLSNPDFEDDASISVYPNPSKENVNISCDNIIKSVQLYDVQGRLLQTSLVNENRTILDVSSQSSGVYFLKIISEKGIGVEKIVRE